MVRRLDIRLVVLPQGLGRVDLHAIQVSERRHGPDLAIGETSLKGLLGGELCALATGQFPQILEHDAACGGQDRHGQLAVQIHDDHLRHDAARDVGRGGHFLRRVGRRVHDADVFDALGVEELLEFAHRHDGLLSVLGRLWSWGFPSTLPSHGVFSSAGASPSERATRGPVRFAPGVVSRLGGRHAAAAGAETCPLVAPLPRLVGLEWVNDARC